LTGQSCLLRHWFQLRHCSLHF